MKLDPKIHPIEYFGLFVRWKITQFTRDEEGKILSFNNFKKERLGLIDFIVGFVTLFVVVISISILYMLILRLN